jgi:hypothetical protein
MNRWWTHLQNADTAEQVVPVAGDEGPHAPHCTIKKIRQTKIVLLKIENETLNPIDNHGP